MESLGKSNEKKWSQIGKLLLLKGEKLPANFALLAGFFIGAAIRIGQEILCLPYGGFFFLSNLTFGAKGIKPKNLGQLQP